MVIINSIAAASATAGAVWLVASSLIALGRLRGGPPAGAFADAPRVALVRPVAGLEHGLEPALRTSFALSYPHVATFFCVEDEADPAVPLIRRLIAEHPSAGARLLIGRDRIGINPKINNIAKAWRATDAQWIAIADSNALLPPDFIEGLMARWAPGRAVVSSPTLIVGPEGLPAEIEAAFVNLSHTRVSLAADRLGIAYVLGKAMLWRRDAMDRIGGLPAIASEFGDDIMARKLILAAGMTARLGRPIPQRSGRRSWREVWSRQLRWLRVSRGPTRSIYLLQLLAANILPMFWIAVLAMTGALPWVALPVFILGWYAVECALALSVGWPVSWRMPLALAIRDLIYIPLWIAGLMPRPVAWRGHVEGPEANPRDPAAAGPGTTSPMGR